MAKIELIDVSKQFGGFVAVNNGNLIIEDGEFFVLLGPSGCGKTTTLRMIAGLELPTDGKILLDGEDVTFLRASKRDIAFVFQLFALYPHMNVRRNLAYPLRSEGLKRDEIRRRVEETANLLQITDILNKRVTGLSGGDRQRVALGRAIIRRPKAFLMDEPLGTLDTEFRELMSQELTQLHRRIGATTVYVTHDQTEAMTMADKIAIMNHGEILQVASPTEIYRKPNSRFVAGFIGSPAMNFLSSDINQKLEIGSDKISVDGSSINMPTLLESVTAPQVTLGIRPEHINIDNGPIRGKVYGVEYVGSKQIITVDTNLGRLKVRLSNTMPIQISEQVGLSFQKDQIILFDQDTGRALNSSLFVGDNRVNA